MEIEHSGSVVTLIANFIFIFYDPNLEFSKIIIQVQYELAVITSIAVE